MYIAELRGKFTEKDKNKEDILTSNVFSFFKYSDRQVYLKPFLEELDFDIQISEKNADDAEFEFWPVYDDRTEPDVVIDVGNYYILFESKYKSDFGKETDLHKDQLSRELEGGKREAYNRNKKFKFVAITADYSEPKEKFNELKNKCEFRWINWHFVTMFLERKMEEQNRSKLIAEDLYCLLKKKGLRKFNGFSSLRVIFEIEKISNVFFDYRSAKYRGKFIGFHKAFEIWKDNVKLNVEKIFWRNEDGQKTID